MLRAVLLFCVLVLVAADPRDQNPVLAQSGASAASGPQLMTRELRTFEESVKDKDVSFRTYTEMLKAALVTRLGEIDVEAEAITKALEGKVKAQRILKLQLGELQTTVEHESVEEILSGTANTLMECASAKTSHDKTTNDEDMMERLIASTLAYIDALKSNPDIRPAQAACLDSVRNTVQDVAMKHTELVHNEGTNHNSSVQVCLDSQRYLLTESAWATANEIPLVEDVVAIRGELRAVQDTVAQLQSRLTALHAEKDIKQERLQSLDREVREHNALVRQQIETFDRLRSLLTM